MCSSRLKNGRAQVSSPGFLFPVTVTSKLSVGDSAATSEEASVHPLPTLSRHVDCARSTPMLCCPELWRIIFTVL